jgi:hypothetical protein
MSGFNAGRPLRNKGLRYPADPPKVEEIISVMRTAGDDAPDLDYTIAIEEPAARTQSASDEDRANRVETVLETAGIRARVGGFNTRPVRDAARHRPRQKRVRTSHVRFRRWLRNTTRAFE